MGDPAPSRSGSVGFEPTEFVDTRIYRPQPGTAVLAVRGEVDTVTAPTFAAATKDLVSGSEQRLVIDMTGVRFLGSSGLAVLVEAAQRVEERGTRLRLVVTTRAVRRPLEVTGTDRLFDLHTELTTATDGPD
jgi:anti-sigma B factor antagonist